MGKHLFSFPFVFFFSLPFFPPRLFFPPSPPPPIATEYDLCKNSSGQSQVKPTVGSWYFKNYSYFLLDNFIFLFFFLSFISPLKVSFSEIQAGQEGGTGFWALQADQAL